jgi:hypothetical protein
LQMTSSAVLSRRSFTLNVQAACSIANVGTRLQIYLASRTETYFRCV